MNEIYRIRTLLIGYLVSLSSCSMFQLNYMHSILFGALDQPVVISIEFV